jgi:hypothetical protein
MVAEMHHFFMCYGRINAPFANDKRRTLTLRMFMAID